MKIVFLCFFPSSQLAKYCSSTRWDLCSSNGERDHRMNREEEVESSGRLAFTWDSSGTSMKSQQIPRKMGIRSSANVYHNQGGFFVPRYTCGFSICFLTSLLISHPNNSASKACCRAMFSNLSSAFPKAWDLTKSICWYPHLEIWAICIKFLHILSLKESQCLIYFGRISFSHHLDSCFGQCGRWKLPKRLLHLPPPYSLLVSLTRHTKPLFLRR